MEIIEQKLLQLPNFDETGRRLQRVMLGYATECELIHRSYLLSPALHNMPP